MITRPMSPISAHAVALHRDLLSVNIQFEVSTIMGAVYLQDVERDDARFWGLHKSSVAHNGSCLHPKYPARQCLQPANVQ
jgi:hypothetical protein